MSTDVTLPALGESVTEGTVTRWLKQVGDTVAADEPLLEVSTDKVDTELPSPAGGVLLEIRAQEDDSVEVGAVLAVIGEASEAGGSEAEPPAEAPEAAAQTTEPEPENQADGELAGPPPPAPTAERTRGADTGGGTEVTLPALGESVTEGTVSRWLKQVGDSVDTDEPLLEVSTDKVDTEIPSPTSGTVLEIRVQEDETVEVGAVLAVVGEATDAAGAPSAPAGEDTQPHGDDANMAATQGEEPVPPTTAAVTDGTEVEDQAAAGAGAAQSPTPAPEPASRPLPEPRPQPAAASSSSTATPRDLTSNASREDPPRERHGPSVPTRTSATPVAAEGDSVYVTPLVRKLAKEHDVDLSSVSGSGVGGRIRKQDVLAAAEAARAAAEQAKAAPAAQPAAAAAQASPAAPAAQPSSLRGTTEKMSRLRRTIAKRMVESLQVS